LRDFQPLLAMKVACFWRALNSLGGFSFSISVDLGCGGEDAVRSWN